MFPATKRTATKLGVSGVLLASLTVFVQSRIWAQQPEGNPRGTFDEPPQPERSPFSSQPIGPGETRIASPGPGSAISKARLAHGAPKTARKEFERGLRAEREGKIDESIRRFGRAVQLDAAYWEALVALADVYWRKGEKANALVPLDLALAIDSNSESLQTNKAVALLDLGRPAEAEEAARRALRLEPRSETDHYLIALAQVRQDRVTAETAQHLEAAVGVPQATDMYERIREYLAAEKAAPKSDGGAEEVTRNRSVRNQ
jgi:tetratricopeptide (TPR) repeat protein